MGGMLWMIASGTVLFAGVLSYGVARRYGWGAAILLPSLALVVMVAMRWQKSALPAAEAMQAMLPMLIFAAPVLLGAVIGASLARIRR